MFNDLLTETKGFKYQITVKVLLKKYRSNGEIEFAPVYFNSSTKTFINRGSGWIIELIESQYINISTYIPLVGGPYIDLPIELQHRRKGLINIKNNDQKCFYGVMLDILIL